MGRGERPRASGWTRAASVGPWRGERSGAPAGQRLRGRGEQRWRRSRSMRVGMKAGEDKEREGSGAQGGARGTTGAAGRRGRGEVPGERGNTGAAARSEQGRGLRGWQGAIGTRSRGPARAAARQWVGVPREPSGGARARAGWLRGRRVNSCAGGAGAGGSARARLVRSGERV